MHIRIVLRLLLPNIEGCGRTAGRWAVQAALLIVASGALLGSAIGQTAPASSIPLWISDPVATARCLAGHGCGRSAVAACVAERTIETAPPALKAEALALSRSKPAEDCRAALAVLAPEREIIREIYRRAPQMLWSDEYIQSMRNYFAACLSSPRMALNRGPVTPAQEHFLDDHTGLIVRQNNPDWPGPQPICQAARLGQFIVTAERCLPAEIKANLRPGDYIPDLGFRFFNSPTIYGVSLHRFGTDKDIDVDQRRDYAIFKIPGTPSLQEDVEPLLGKARPLDDFVTVTAHIIGVLNRDLRTGAALNFDPATTIHKNTLCRPGYVSVDGLFLHGCLIDSALSVGAPMFQRQNGKYVFVGIHVGDTITLKEPSLAACARGLNKYGIAIPPSVLQEAFSN